MCHFFDFYHGCMRKLNKDLFRKQIEVYLCWQNRNFHSAHNHERWLDWFYKTSHREDVMDIIDDDLEVFFEQVDLAVPSQWERTQARTAVRSFIRYYEARTKNGKTRLSRGRPPALARYQLVGELKDGIRTPSFREIGILMNPEKPVDRSLVHRWYTAFKNMRK